LLSIGAPIFLSFGFNKKFDSNLYKDPLLKVFAVLAGYLFLVTITTIFLRVATKESTP
jgi:hypothetical protein